MALANIMLNLVKVIQNTVSFNPGERAGYVNVATLVCLEQIADISRRSSGTYESQINSML